MGARRDIVRWLIPLAVAAGLAVLEELYADPQLFDRIEGATRALGEGLSKAAAAADVALQVQSVGSMGCPYFSATPVHDFAEASACDTAAFYRFHAAMLRRGVYLAPSPYEAFFVSAAHGEAEVEATIAAATEAMAETAAPGS